MLTDVRDRVKSGTDLSEAFAEHGDLFPRLYPSSLKAGEKSGELEAVIRRFVRYMKLVLDARRRVISALTYPAVLVVLSITMIAVMTIYVVPRFMGFFTELDADLPMITQIVLGVSTFMSANWVLMLMVLIGASLGAALVGAHRAGAAGARPGEAAGAGPGAGAAPVRAGGILPLAGDVALRRHPARAVVRDRHRLGGQRLRAQPAGADGPDGARGASRSTPRSRRARSSPTWRSTW